jgi:hypothetical protein
MKNMMIEEVQNRKESQHVTMLNDINQEIVFANKATDSGI